MLSFSIILALISLFPLPQLQVEKLHRKAILGPNCSDCEIQTPGTPVYSGSVNLLSYAACNAAGGQPGPWGAKVTPDGNFAYVTLSGFSGGVGVQNCKVVKIDLANLNVVLSRTVGLFPEEIAFTLDTCQEIRNVFITNSSSGTVSVLNGNDNVVATIALPDTQGFGTCYPYGIAISRDQQRAYVGTLDGSGDIYVINTNTRTLEPTETMNFGAGVGFGRLDFHSRKLVIPATIFHNGFTGSTTGVIFVNPSQPNNASSIILDSADGEGRFPNAQDVAIRCDGVGYLAGFDMGNVIYTLDLNGETFSHTFASGTSGGGHQSIELSNDGMLAIADFWSDEVAFCDGWTENWLSTEYTGATHLWLADIAFSPSGNKMLMPANISDNLAVYDIQ